MAGLLAGVTAKGTRTRHASLLAKTKGCRRERSVLFWWYTERQLLSSMSLTTNVGTRSVDSFKGSVFVSVYRALLVYVILKIFVVDRLA